MTVAVGSMTGERVLFTQTDPMPRGAGSAFESPYAYANNNPAVYVDPSGLRSVAVKSKGAGRLAVAVPLPRPLPLSTILTPWVEFGERLKANSSQAILMFLPGNDFESPEYAFTVFPESGSAGQGRAHLSGVPGQASFIPHVADVTSVWSAGGFGVDGHKEKLPVIGWWAFSYFPSTSLKKAVIDVVNASNTGRGGGKPIDQSVGNLASPSDGAPSELLASFHVQVFVRKTRVCYVCAP